MRVEAKKKDLMLLVVSLLAPSRRFSSLISHFVGWEHEHLTEEIEGESLGVS